MPAVDGHASSDDGREAQGRKGKEGCEARQPQPATPPSPDQRATAALLRPTALPPPVHVHAVDMVGNDNDSAMVPSCPAWIEGTNGAVGAGRLWTGRPTALRLRLNSFECAGSVRSWVCCGSGGRTARLTDCCVAVQRPPGDCTHSLESLCAVAVPSLPPRAHPSPCPSPSPSLSQPSAAPRWIPPRRPPWLHSSSSNTSA